MTYDIVEIMNQKYGITQRHAVIIATTRYKQDFPGTQELFFEQVTRNTDMPLLTKNKYMLLQPIAASHSSLLIETEPKEASRWIFRAYRTVLLL